MAENLTGLYWEVDDILSYGVFSYGTLQKNTDSTIHKISIVNSGGLTFYGCCVYLKPNSNPELAEVAVKHYEQLLWYGSAYPGYGLTLMQDYSVTGQISEVYDGKLVDYNRNEFFDVFKGYSMNITAGKNVGNSRIIKKYDPYKRQFELESDFFADPVSDKYSIGVNSAINFKQGVGSSLKTAVYLLNNGGILKPGETASMNTQIKVPAYEKKAGNFFVDFVFSYQYSK